MKKSLLVLITLVVFHLASANVTLPRLISSGMVLQRDVELKIWGWADAGEMVRVNFQNTDYSAIADDNGVWSVLIPRQNVGGPHIMTIEGNNKIEIDNILIGDVWLCSGQSNMELPVRRVMPIYEDEVKNAENNMIRHFAVPQQYNFKHPEADLSGGQWIECNPTTVKEFSAVAWFFARSLYDTYKVPIGLINASLGGSPAEAWMSYEALGAFPHYQNEAIRYRDDLLIADIQTNDRDRSNLWYRQSTEKDAGNATGEPSWKQPGINTSDWDTISMPGYWPLHNEKPLNGVVWLRKSFNIDNIDVSQPSQLILGAIVDADSVFVNGSFVGTTSYQYPPRRYNVPSGVIRNGENSIVVRVISNIGRGGFVPEKEYALHTNNQTVTLDGIWNYKVGAVMDPLQGETFIRWKPNGLFNAMIVPLTPYKMKGVIWYQGESNTGNPAEYADLFPALIRDWRTQFNHADMPFLFVQLSNFMKSYPHPTDSHWARTREAQAKALSLPNTGMAVTIDVGEWNDVHPLNKKSVGNRLALAARRVAYNEKSVVSSGPVLKSFKVKKDKIELTFTSTAKSLKTNDSEDVKSIAIAGSDHKFVWAKSKIKGSKLVVWHESVANPVAVRYGWADNPEGANLINSEGLPASPFRTDTW